jgi:glycosyltransferase involved in cell wall biosynthesis
MTREMFAFFRELRERRPDFIMLIFSKDDPARIRRDAQEAGLPEEAIRIRPVARTEIRNFLHVCDCSIFFIRPTYSKMASSPTKHAELMGMGLPVICNEIGDTGHIVRDTGTGMIVSEFDSKHYQEVIDKIDELLAIPPEKIRKAAFQYFDLEEGIRRYSAIYKRLLAKPE